MPPSIALKSMLAALLQRTGYARRRLARISRAKAGILMYHRILPSGLKNPGVEPGMYVYRDTFERQVRLLKKYCTLVPLGRILGNGDAEAHKNDKPLCVLTFDDGWADFFTYAFPVLQAHQAPATVFLPTDYIGTDQWFWTDRLGHLLARQAEKGAAIPIPKTSKNPLVNQILGRPGDPLDRLERAIADLKAYPQEEIEPILQEMAAMLQVEPSPPGRAFLTWEEIREMAASGLVGFGSHTAGHAILTTVGEAAVKAELIKSKEKLLAENITPPHGIPFCYPNGNYNQQIARQVREAGYSLAVCTEFGWNGGDQDRFALKRIPIHNDMTSHPDLFLCRLAGIF